MSKWKVKPLDRDFAAGLLCRKEHHVQSSLRWFDFIREHSNEEDRSVTLHLGGEPVAFLCALQFRNLIQSLPYPASYSGLQAESQLSASELGEAHEILFEHYSKYCDVLSICRSPLFADQQSADLTFDYVRESTVHVLDLSADPRASTTSKFRNNLQRNLRKAEMAGVEISVETGTTELENWYDVYEKRIADLGGTQLPFAYFEAMFRYLQPSGNCSLITAKAGGKLLGGILTVQNKHCLDYYLSMFDRDEDDKQASTAAFHFVMNYAKQQAIPVMNLQSSPRSQTDLIRFKESWGAIPTGQRYLVKILNNATAILEQSSKAIGQRYPFHFLVPFDALTPEAALVSTNDL